MSGNKKSLQDRLLKAVEDGVPVGESRSIEETSKSKKKGEDEVPAGFPPTAYWKVLNHESVCIDEPSNPTFKAPHALTQPEYDEKVPVKYNFAKTFDRTVWQGRMESSMIFVSGIQKKNSD